MTAKKAFKQRVRARAARTGESYTAALRHLRLSSEGAPMPDPAAGTFYIAAAQLDSPIDPRGAASLRRPGQDVRQLMSEARDQGARLIHFGEGALCSPHKRIMSSVPDAVAAADWSRFDWATQRNQLERIAEHASQLKLWTVIGAVHRLSAPHRPHNSLYVIDERGAVATRYDERMLSSTKLSFMYTPGSGPLTFNVDGVRFGCTLGMETQYPELFAEYERADVQCVLTSTMDHGATFALQASAHASTNSCWVSYATTSADAASAPAGLADPTGAWAARCPTENVAAIITADIGREPEPFARPWRRAARGGRYADAVIVGDPRADRTSF